MMAVFRGGNRKNCYEWPSMCSGDVWPYIIGGESTDFQKHSADFQLTAQLFTH